MKGYCKQCSMVIDETEQKNGYCYDCYNNMYLAMRDAYIKASNILEEVHYKVERVQSELTVLRQMINDMKALFQKGWGVPK